MKKNKLVILSLIGVLLFCACAGTYRDRDYPCGEKHFLWKVSGESGNVWLLGSIHFADSSFYPLAPVIDSAYRTSGTLGVEMNVKDDSVSDATARLMISDGMFKDGKTLRDLLPDSAWKKLESLADGWDVPVEAFVDSRPWLAAMQVSAIALEHSGIDPQYGIDEVMLDRASTDGKAILELETPADQMGVFSDVSDSAGVAYLVSTIEEAGNTDSLVRRFETVWKCGDVSTMRKLLEEDDSESGTPFEKRLYDDRNRVMADKVDSLLKAGGNAFVVVGAAHLVKSGNNVLRLLKDRGYKIERY
jgi:uncharacterized protein